MQEIIKSKKFKIIVAIMGVILVALVSFATGITVGLHKAKFSNHFGENYEKNFMGPRPEMGRPMGPMGAIGEKINDFEGRGFRNAHGLAGTVISVTDNSLVIKDRDNKENAVAITDKTMLKSGRDDIKISDLKQNDNIVVMGQPSENGTINADLIRVFNNNENNNGGNQ